MNCHKAVARHKAKFFAEVFICEDCYAQAEHFFQRLERELTHLLTMSKEAIRVALVTGKFNFPEGSQGEVGKREVLEAILQLEEARKKSVAPQ